MNPLIYVTVSLHFEVSNSEMFGGKGTIGYMAINLGVVSTLGGVNETLIDKQMKVTREDVRLISKEEYDFETEDEDY